MEARVVSLYAGGCAQRRADPRTGTDGCDSDEAAAADLLHCYGWQSRETSLRDRAEHLVEKHWSEIVAVADELARQHSLDNTEVELIADAAAGHGEFIFGSLDADLAHYRAFRRSASNSRNATGTI